MSVVKKILLVGRGLQNVPSKDEVSFNNTQLFAAATLEEVKAIFEKNTNIDIVISGGGIELKKRLEIVQYIFETSDATSVHLKDIDSGPEGYIPFINKVLKGLLS